MSGGAIFMIVVCAAFPTLIIVAFIVKLIEVRKAKRWPSTTGKVLQATVKARVNKPGDAGYDFSDTEVNNEPFVQYEYTVGSKKYRNNRITIGDKTSGSEIEGILARYPVGTTVTVYYDPANPQTAVLERDIFDRTMFAGLGCLMLFLIGGPLIAYFTYYSVLDWIRPRIADPNTAPFLTALGMFSCAALFMMVGYTAVMLQTRRWPKTRGKIIGSESQSFSDYDSETGRSRTMHRPSILYTYEVNGRKYTGDRITLGAKVSSTVRGLSRRMANRYPVGKEVVVRYNPKNPGEAVLKAHTGLAYIFWLVIAALFAFAWAVATGRISQAN